MGRGTPPQGRLRDHDHSRAGEGGSSLDVGDIVADMMAFDDNDTLDFGTDDDISLKFDPAVGPSGALVVRDEATGENRLALRIGDALRLLGQTVDLAGNDLVDGGTTIWDQSAGEIPNAAVEALANFAANDVFAGYPIGLGADTDRDLAGNDLVDGGTTIWDQSAGEIPNAVVEALANLAADEQLSAYPLEAADVDESTIAVTDFGIGTVADGEAVGNSGGSLAGISAGGTSLGSPIISPRQNATSNSSSESGMVVVPRIDITKMIVGLYPSCTASRFRIVQNSNGTVIHTEDISGVSGGDTFEVSGFTMSAGTEYRIWCDNSGGIYTRAQNNAEIPPGSNAQDLRAKAGWDNGSEENSFTGNIWGVRPYIA